MSDDCHCQFSPDTTRLTHSIRRNDSWLLVVDGVEGGEYDFLTDRRVVFDGPGRLHTIVRRGEEYRLLEVGTPGP